MEKGESKKAALILIGHYGMTNVFHIQRGNWLYSKHPYLDFSDLFWCVLEVCFVEWLPENVVDLVPVKHPHPLRPRALGRAVVEVIQVHVVFGLGIAGIKKNKAKLFAKQLASESLHGKHQRNATTLTKHSLRKDRHKMCGPPKIL